MRLDYVLPSANFRYVGAGVFWPSQQSAEAAIVDGSDHRLVWVDSTRTTESARRD
jgi:hypothetical protein